jgi:hypothetical protein
MLIQHYWLPLNTFLRLTLPLISILFGSSSFASTYPVYTIDIAISCRVVVPFERIAIILNNLLNSLVLILLGSSGKGILN